MNKVRDICYQILRKIQFDISFTECDRNLYYKIDTDVIGDVCKVLIENDFNIQRISDNLIKINTKNISFSISENEIQQFSEFNIFVNQRKLVF